MNDTKSDGHVLTSVVDHMTSVVQERQLEVDFFFLLTPLDAIASVMARHQTPKQELSSPKQAAETSQQSEPFYFRLAFVTRERLCVSSLM